MRHAHLGWSDPICREVRGTGLMEKPRLMIVGAGGFVGAHLARDADRAYTVLRTATRGNRASGIPIDITSAPTVERAFEVARPDIVVLLAAISDIDRCEANPEEALAVNVRGAEHVAKACARANIRLLFASTAAVFDGGKHGYCETDLPAPLSVYGRSKAEAEAIVRGLMSHAVVVRFAQVIGFPVSPGTNSMVESLFRQWKAGKPTPLSTTEERNPLHVQSLSEAILRLLGDEKAHGTYHLGAGDSISRYALGKRLAKLGGFPEHMVEVQNGAVADRAPRGRDHFLLTEKYERRFGVQSPSCEQEIARCFHGIA
jgi:dTDP-4-dehydrorhamnose reductase